MATAIQNNLGNKKMKRFEFICKGKRSHFIDAATEELARAQFAENKFTSELSIIDVVEFEVPVTLPQTTINAAMEGFTKTVSDSVPTQAELDAQVIGSIKVGF